MASKIRYLHQPFEIEGYWWFPENPDKKVPGIVKFDSTNVKLKLLGTLTDPIKDQDKWDYEIILGFSTRGEEITLHKCNPTKSDTFIPGIGTSEFSAIHMFIGIHFMNSEEIKFKSMTMRYSEFDEWLGFSGFKVNTEKLVKNREFELNYVASPEIKFQINENLSAAIGFGFSVNMTYLGEKTYSIKQNAGFTLESKTELNLAKFLSTIHEIQNFLTLATLTQVHTLKIEGTSEKNKQIDGQKTNYPKIEIFKTVREPIMLNNTTSSMFMLFRYHDIKENILVFFQKWFANKKTLEPIYNLYFELIYNNHLAIETRFLLLTQAVESYHRRTSDETEFDKESYEKRIDTILNSVPQEYKDWLLKELQHSNELTLRKRLKKLLEEFPFVLDKNSLEKGKFISYIIENRNYLTHYDKTIEISKDYNTMHFVSQRLALLIESALLLEIGFTIEKIEELIQKSKVYKGLKYEKHS